MQKGAKGFLEHAKAILNEISGSWLSQDRLVDILDSLKNWRSYITQAIGLPTRQDVLKVENLIANSQIKIQRLESSVQNLETLVSQISSASQKPASKARKATETEPLTAKSARPPKIGKKPPTTLLEIDLKGKKPR